MRAQQGPQTDPTWPMASLAVSLPRWGFAPGMLHSASTASSASGCPKESCLIPADSGLWSPCLRRCSGRTGVPAGLCSTLVPSLGTGPTFPHTRGCRGCRDCAVRSMRTVCRDQCSWRGSVLIRRNALIGRVALGQAPRVGLRESRAEWGQRGGDSRRDGTARDALPGTQALG